MKRQSKTTLEGFSKLRHWIRTSVPLAGVRRDLLRHVNAAAERNSECSFAMGPDLNRSGSPVLVELRHGEVFVFMLDGEEAALLLGAPNRLFLGTSASKAGPPPEARIELLDFQIDHTDLLDPDGVIGGECRFRFLPGVDPLESVTFESEFGSLAPGALPGFHHAPDPFTGTGSEHSPFGTSTPGSGFPGRGIPKSPHPGGFDYCFSLDFEVLRQWEGQTRITRITRYTYLPLHRGMGSARFEFGASPQRDPEMDDSFLPQVAAAYLRLCAAPPPASHLRATPLGRALGKVLIFG